MGFLCFDHKDVKYFNLDEEVLIKIGYIIADILTLYLMYFCNHITGSKTINEINKLLVEKKII